jgi:hypothetical protein
MALIVHINRSVQAGAEVYNALHQIRAGIGKLEELDGLRAEAVAVNQDTMAAVFGIPSNAEAQALSDRWVALLAAHNDSGNAEFAKLRDLIDALVAT